MRNSSRNSHIKNFTDPQPIKCPLCGESVSLLTKAHMRIRHSMTKEEFLKLYPKFDQFAFWGEIPASGHYEKKRKKKLMEG